MKKQLRYRFIAFPIHLDTYWLLNKDEKEILKCLIRLDSKGWFYGDKKLAKNLQIGMYHFKRAKLRLHMLGLIKIIKRGRQSFIYYFDSEMENWRLTEEVCAKLQIDHEKMNLGRIVFKKEPFKNDEHFNNCFALNFPKYAKSRKGRKKDESDESFEIHEILNENQDREPVSKFKVLNERLETAHPTKILSDFFNYRPQINALKYDDLKLNDPLEIQFYKSLDAKAEKLINEPDEKLKLILNEVQFRVEKGDSWLSISNYLLSVYKSQINSAKIGSQNEV